jgi:hypothetical protein
VFSLYAARSGQAALDRLYDGDSNPNSVFSRVLVPMLAKPGIDLRDLAYLRPGGRRRGPSLPGLCM